MTSSGARSIRTIGWVLLIVLVSGLVIGFAVPLMILGLAMWGAGALGLWLGERARALRRRNSV